MKRQLLMVLSLVLLAGPVIAQQQIEGAFGLNLGEPFDLDKSTGQSELADGTVMYQFSPATPFRSFDRYYVMVTPATKIVYSIWGIGTTETALSCDEHGANIFAALQQKYRRRVTEERTTNKIILEILHGRYGERHEEGLTDGTYGFNRVEQENRGVVIGCTGDEGTTIEVRYYDHLLRKQAERERLELEASAIDAAGL